MNAALLGQNWTEFLLPLLFLVVYGAVHAVRTAGENKKPPPQRRPPPRPVRPQAQPAPPAGVPADPRLELDRFLEELGVKPTKPQSTPPPIKPPRRERVQNRPARANPEAAPSTRASQRHFESQLEQRHSDSVHSQIESQHLQTHVQAVAPTVVAAGDAPQIARTAGDAAMNRLVQDRSMLSRAMILGIVLGSPIGLGDSDRRV